MHDLKVLDIEFRFQSHLMPILSPLHINVFFPEHIFALTSALGYKSARIAKFIKVTYKREKN